MKYQEMYEKAFAAGVVRNLTPTYFDFEHEGDRLIGRYLTKSEVSSSVSDGTYYQYIFDTDEGLTKFHLGKSTDAEAGQMFREGLVYAIEFLGKCAIGRGRMVNKFKVSQITLDNGDDAESSVAPTAIPAEAVV